MLSTPADRESARHGGEAGRAARAARQAAERHCRWCSVSLAGRRPHAVFCGRVHATAYRRAKRRIAVRRAHPRCVICSAPMEYGKSGLNFRARTCGDRSCAVTLANWKR